METINPMDKINPVEKINAKDLLEKMLALMGIEAKVVECSAEGIPLLTIESPEAGRLIGKFGQTLNDLQYMINRMLYKQVLAAAEGEARPPRVIIDIEHYRERQRDDLIKIAREGADKVRRWGDPVELEPMNSFDRRLVHQSFAADPEIETASSDEEWDGGRKRITLRLRQNQPSSGQQ